MAPPAVGARRRDAEDALRAPRAPLCGRVAPLPALAPAQLQPGTQPRRCLLPLPPRDAMRRVPLAAVDLPRQGTERRAGRPGDSVTTILTEPDPFDVRRARHA